MLLLLAVQNHFPVVKFTAGINQEENSITSLVNIYCAGFTKYARIYLMYLIQNK